MLLQVPLTAVLLLFELTHDYFIIIPTLASVGISYWVASFPMASLLQPLSPLLSRWPHGSPMSASSLLRTLTNEEASAAVSEALSASAPLTAVAPAAEAAALLQDDSQELLDGRGEVVHAAAGGVPRSVVAANGLLRAEHAGQPGRMTFLGRGSGATVSFSGSSTASAPAPSAKTNGASPERAVDDSSSGGVGGPAACGQVGEGGGLVGSLPIRPKDRSVEDLTVLCALRQACVMLTPDTSLSEALEASSRPILAKGSAC